MRYLKKIFESKIDKLWRNSKIISWKIIWNLWVLNYSTISRIKDRVKNGGELEEIFLDFSV